MNKNLVIPDLGAQIYTILVIICSIENQYFEYFLRKCFNPIGTFLFLRRFTKVVEHSDSFWN